MVVLGSFLLSKLCLRLTILVEHEHVGYEVAVSHKYYMPVQFIDWGSLQMEFKLKTSHVGGSQLVPKFRSMLGFVTETNIVYSMYLYQS